MIDSYRKGLEQITATDPEAGPVFVEQLSSLSPDFAEFLVGFAFGTIHARQILDPKTKEMVAMANLIALGGANSHLRLRILAALNVGCTRSEIIEVAIQSIAYAGFTRASVAMALIREVFAEYVDKSSKEDATLTPTALTPFKRRPASSSKGKGTTEP